MDNQKMFFLAGLPRSGNTLLSAILNQNPDVYCSPISNLSGALYGLDGLNFSQNSFRTELVKERTFNSITQYAKNYYSDIDKKYIIDRNKEWATESLLPIIKKYITDNPKIIFTVRDISEILASMVLISKNIFLQQIEDYKESCEIPYFKNENETIAEFILLYNTAFTRVFDGLNHFLNSKNIFFVEYNDIVYKPKETMMGIYNFLEIKNYEHDFSNIEKKEVDNDILAGDVDNMHHVRKTLSKITDPKSVFSQQAIERYDKMNIWR
jgi:sulfotransferase